MSGYPPIADHGLVGDLRTVALVDTAATIDWYCCPRFDSPSVFGSLLDAERGGSFRLAPDREVTTTKPLYLPDTNVLITRFPDRRRRRRDPGFHAGQQGRRRAPFVPGAPSGGGTRIDDLPPGGDAALRLRPGRPRC